MQVWYRLLRSPRMNKREAKWSARSEGKCCTYQHFGKAPLELDGVRHRLSRRVTHAAATRVRSAQAAHAQAGLTRVMRRAGLDATDENLAYTTIIFATATLHDAHVFFSFLHARARSRRRISRTEIFGNVDSRRWSLLDRSTQHGAMRNVSGRIWSQCAHAHTQIHIHTYTNEQAHTHTRSAHDGARHTRVYREMSTTGVNATVQLSPRSRWITHWMERWWVSETNRNVQQVSPSGRPSRIPRLLRFSQCAHGGFLPRRILHCTPLTTFTQRNVSSICTDLLAWRSSSRSPVPTQHTHYTCAFIVRVYHSSVGAKFKYKFRR